MKITNAKEEDLKELLEILDCFFDPEKKPVQPKPRFFQNNRKGPRRDKENKDKNANMTKPEEVADVKTEIKAEPVEPPQVTTDTTTNNISSATA